MRRVRVRVGTGRGWRRRTLSPEGEWLRHITLEAVTMQVARIMPLSAEPSESTPAPGLSIA